MELLLLTIDQAELLQEGLHDFQADMEVLQFGDALHAFVHVLIKYIVFKNNLPKRIEIFNIFFIPE